MDNSPFLSIVTPTLNSADNLERCLISVANQTYKNIEHLIIDGLSSDATLVIIKKYQTQYSHLRFISEKDRGIYDAMNKGINLALGDWIYFLGSDDEFFNSDVVKQFEKEASNNNYDVIYGDVFSSRFKGRYDGEFTYSKILNQNMCHQSIFFKKTVFNQIGLFNLNYNSHADWDHNIRWFFSRSITKKYIDLVIANYADGGFSSLNDDAKFKNERILKYLLYGNNQLTFKIRTGLLRKELVRTANKQNIFLFVKLVFNSPKIIAGGKLFRF